MSDDERKTHWLNMLAKVDADIERIQSALMILNQVWIDKPNDLGTGIDSAIIALGGEVARLQRQRVECEYFMNKSDLVST